jgi:hypothetical protein
VGLLQDSIRSNIEGTVQGAVENAVANALAAKSAPDGTVASVETLGISPTTGLTLHPWASFSLEKACGLTPSGGCTSLRSAEQLTHLRAIRDRLLRCSPQGVAYIELFELFSPELVRTLLADENLLRSVDRIVSRVLEEFPYDRPGEGRLYPEVAKDVMRAMDRVRENASAELSLTLAAPREDVPRFVGRPAAEVLTESFCLIDESSSA